ncbi:SusC/RagA family TonB-linked outer membrane protein [Hymenobacter arizonensis]|uniref:TonB-linked outer membrane protein, SusC/RagA family n=1 Tax=Hymenobacter arizonensis TaxID=1227077 RepID=A0A1I6BL52_HYMAR|nr:TonB-dependent receptor [Hymenobacter arizonensis]SFQ81557.1 TonB-linked outer membrane protein, SusC/RagA family [Hymenobacter arizonensis]
MKAFIPLEFRRYVRPLVLLPALSLGLGNHLAALPRAAVSSRAVLADITISGQVVDEKGVGLPGVNVIVKGTSNGVQTDATGNYKLVAPDNATLVFTFVGYLAEEVAVGGRTTINSKLNPDSKALEEVVVVGYGVQEKKLLATSISTISAKQVELLPVASPSEALVGLVAGAQITEPSGEPGAGAVIRIRGLGSISAGNNPLYVVDGYPLNNADSYFQIPPADIQSVQVLKDAAACAIYGSRGANGIVIVTTKRGGTDGKTRFNFSANTGVQQVAKRVDLLNRDQFLEYFKESYTNANRAFTPAMTTLFAQDQNSLPDTDWQDEIFQTGVQQQYQLGASGGTDKSRFYISGGYFNQTGIVKGSGFERFSLRANYDAQLNSKLKLGLSLAPNFSRTDLVPTTGSYNNANTSNGAGGQTGAVTTALILAPIVPVRLPNGDYAGLRTGSNQAITNPGDLLSPVAPLDLYQDRNSAVRALGSMFLDFEVLKGLHLRTNFGAELINSRRSIYVPATLSTASNQTANLSNPILNNVDARRLNSTNLNWLLENTATYNRSFGSDHSVTLLAGYAAQYNTAEGSTVLGQTGTYTNTNIEYPTAAGQVFGQGLFNNENALTSVFGRFDYAFKERYILTAALRTDGSSRFGPDKRYATFPSVALAWRVAEEPFIKQFSTISELKLRASYGVTGNNNIGDYNFQAYQAGANYVFGTGTGTRAFGFSPNGVAIRDLSWETNKQFDAGFDLGLFRDRIYLTVAAYERNTTDLLLNRNIPALLGFSTRALANVGEVRNRGLEFQVNTANIQGKDFTWSTAANLSFNRNQVIALAGANEQITFDAVFGYASSIRVVPGQPLGVFYGYQQEGVYLNQADIDSSPRWTGSGTVIRPGDLKFRDVNGDGQINSSDIGVIGNPFPDFTFGLQNTLGYKAFSLAFTLQGSQGNDVLYGSDRYVVNGQGGTNGRTNLLNRWRSPENPGDGMTPVATVNGSLKTVFNSHYVHDASFLRVRNVTLRYQVPSELVKRASLQSLGIYTSIQNLYTFTKYFGYNPEANNFGNTTSPTYGVDQGAFPMARTITLGVQLGF